MLVIHWCNRADQILWLPDAYLFLSYLSLVDLVWNNMPGQLKNWSTYLNFKHWWKSHKYQIQSSIFTFHPANCLGPKSKIFGQTSTVTKWNYGTLWIHPLTGCWKVSKSTWIFYVKNHSNISDFFFSEQYHFRSKFFVKMQLKKDFDPISAYPTPLPASLLS